MKGRDIGFVFLLLNRESWLKTSSDTAEAPKNEGQEKEGGGGKPDACGLDRSPAGAGSD